jgi:uncharacterized damage-inducible protein DinB
MIIPRPNPDEYGMFYAGYVARVPDGVDFFALLQAQPDELRALVQHLPDDEAGERPKPAEWSVKEVLGHLCDSERILSYRAICVARGDTTPLPSFDQDEYVRHANFNARTVAALLDEFTALRYANLHSLQTLTDAELVRRGTASNQPVSARSLLYMMAGHVMHHLESLKVDYRVGF